VGSFEQMTLFDEYREQQQEQILWELYVDGAARGNPGPAGVGVCLLKNGQEVFADGFYIGKATNNQAEYIALALGLFFYRQLTTSCDTLLIYSDSELMVKQMQGNYKIKNSILKALSHCIQEVLASSACSIKHVIRSKNSRADELANKGIDEKKTLPSAFESFCPYRQNI